MDLHIHSKYSDDGQYSPEELMRFCLEKGVKTAAVADHNTVRGIEEARYWAEMLNISLITAIELDCVHKSTNLHLLGYWINPDFEDFSKVENMIMEQERAHSEKRIELVRKTGIYVDSDKAFELAVGGVVTGEIIAEVVLNDERNNANNLLEPYLGFGSRADNPYVNFYWDFCSQGKPAYVKIDYITLNEAVELIKKAGGISVLAHPWNNIGKSSEMLADIIRQGVCGVEAYSSYHSVEQTVFYAEYAKKSGLAVSCGSDFHGKTKPKINIGSVDCEGKEQEILSGLLRKR